MIESVWVIIQEARTASGHGEPGEDVKDIQDWAGAFYHESAAQDFYIANRHKFYGTMKVIELKMSRTQINISPSPAQRAKGSGPGD